MSTTTTNFGLVKPELTDVTDITAMNPNWDLIDEKLYEVDGKSSKSTTAAVTLVNAAWDGNTLIFRNSAIKSEFQLIELLPASNITREQLEQLQAANIVGTSQAIGSITLTAFGEVPTIDIPVVFIIRGDV